MALASPVASIRRSRSSTQSRSLTASVGSTARPPSAALRCAASRRPRGLDARRARRAVAPFPRRQGHGLYAQALGPLCPLHRRRSHLPVEQCRREGATTALSRKTILAVRRIRLRRRARGRHVDSDRHRQAQRRRPPSLARRRTRPHRRDTAEPATRTPAVEMAATQSAQSGRIAHNCHFALHQRHNRPGSTATHPPALAGCILPFRGTCARCTDQTEKSSRTAREIVREIDGQIIREPTVVTARAYRTPAPQLSSWWPWSRRWRSRRALARPDGPDAMAWLSITNASGPAAARSCKRSISYGFLQSWP